MDQEEDDDPGGNDVEQQAEDLEEDFRGHNLANQAAAMAGSRSAGPQKEAHVQEFDQRRVSIITILANSSDHEADNNRGAIIKTESFQSKLFKFISIFSRSDLMNWWHPIQRLN